jgi:SAM-dependent methyltransferase
MRVRSSGIGSTGSGANLAVTWTGRACGPGRSSSRSGRRAYAPSSSWDAEPANDAARLAGEGYSVTAIDLSGEAIGRAQAKFGAMVRFMVADITRRLPFPDRGFDAVMSNVVVHMFPDGVTRAVFAEAGRLVRTGGLFLFHVNALEDRPLRARSLPARELEPDYVAEESGQTMHFFSEAYLRELLEG